MQVIDIIQQIVNISLFNDFLKWNKWNLIYWNLLIFDKYMIFNDICAEIQNIILVEKLYLWQIHFDIWQN